MICGSIYYFRPECWLLFPLTLTKNVITSGTIIFVCAVGGGSQVSSYSSVSSHAQAPSVGNGLLAILESVLLLKNEFSLDLGDLFAKTKLIFSYRYHSVNFVFC